MIASVVANAFRGKDASTFTPADFFPSLKPRARVQTVEDAETALDQWFRV